MTRTPASAGPDRLAAGALRTAVVVVLFAGVAFAVEQLVPGARARLSRADPGWLAAAVGLELGAFALLPTGIGGPVLRFWALRASGFPLRTMVVRSLSHGGVFNAPYVAAALVPGDGVRDLGPALRRPGALLGVASGVNIGLGAAAIICYRAVSLGTQGAVGALAFTTLAAELRRPSRRIEAA
jgi:hypothetical protein